MVQNWTTLLWQEFTAVVREQFVSIYSDRLPHGICFSNSSSLVEIIMQHGFCSDVELIITYRGRL